MSYIHLHDGQLLSDDLFQNDLSYELVTLSACETGRAEAVSGDELIGLGRGFLYAGTGALIASLWRIEDQLTLRLMNKLYRGLKHDHLSKAAALRRAQLDLFREEPTLHPLFWGAFQLIGSAEPLSVGEY
jgi:CHAT domain-containing protein